MLARSGAADLFAVARTRIFAALRCGMQSTEQTGAQTSDTVYLFDVDNTLLDNDKVTADLRQHLEAEFGASSAQRYWSIFEALRTELGYADYLGALQRYRLDAELALFGDTRLLKMSAFLLDYPFPSVLYPGALDVLRHFQCFGKCVILSDGDAVFQPRKVQRSGLWDAVDGRVLIYIHKEKMLDAMQRSFPARHYVMVDDKLRILAAMKSAMAERLTTVFVRQGHYALDVALVAQYPPADVTVDTIAALTASGIERLVPLPS